ncbi:uncharacterized protein [Drosophila kikkawai]|uniref:Uncharacterized protein n=1 Tax=Drosophila kikkawai TaxID=30033 RepID=A0A6P4IG41_DROKI|nr:uncharacterized protein LOC108074274 [Drosophila kikkawai]
MLPTDKNSNKTLDDLSYDILDQGPKVHKSPSENHIVVECVGDSRDAGPSRASASTLVQPEQLDPRQKEGAAEGSASVSTHSTYQGQVPLYSTCQGQKKKSILTTESKTNPLYKEKLRQRLRLLFVSDADIQSMPTEKAAEPSLESQLKPSRDSSKLENRLDDLTKRVLILDTNMDSLA